MSYQPRAWSRGPRAAVGVRSGGGPGLSLCLHNCPVVTCPEAPGPLVHLDSERRPQRAWGTSSKGDIGTRPWNAWGEGHPRRGDIGWVRSQSSTSAALSGSPGRVARGSALPEVVLRGGLGTRQPLLHSGCPRRSLSPSSRTGLTRSPARGDEGTGQLRLATLQMLGGVHCSKGLLPNLVQRDSFPRAPSP